MMFTSFATFQTGVGVAPQWSPSPFEGLTIETTAFLFKACQYCLTLRLIHFTYEGALQIHDISHPSTSLFITRVRADRDC